MCPFDDAALVSAPSAPSAQAAPLRTAGGVLSMRWTARRGATRLADLQQRTPYRLFQPAVAPGEPPLAVIANVSGGIVGGDRLTLQLEVAEAAALTVTGQAAEKLYRSGGRQARLDNDIALAAGARLDWLPQGTILFDAVEMRRSTTLALAPDARLLFGECLIFGRHHMGERLTRGRIDDRLTVSVDGRRVLIDRFRLDDPAALLDDPFGLDGATATALAVLHGPDPDGLLEAARGMLAAADPGTETLRCGATRRGPLVLARWLGRDAAALRCAMGGFWRAARHHVLGFPTALPSLWAI